MRLTRVFVPQPLAPDAQVTLPDGPAQHLARVLRMTAGAPLIVFNGEGGEHEAVIESIRKAEVTVRIGAHHAIERESPLQVTLLQGIARGEKMDLILQKATELGVTRVVPVLSARSTVRLNAQSAPRKQTHWQAVVASACEQCGRNRVPEVAAPAPLAAAVHSTDAALKLLLTPDDNAAGLDALATSLADADKPTPVWLLAGPEGGLDAAEVQAAKLAGFVGIRLGPRVLRTETAALAALAALQFMAGDY